MKTSREFKIGFVAIITLALTILGLNFLKGKNLLSPTNSYYLYYDDIADLKESAFVNMFGMKIGTVSDIKVVNLKNKTKVQVKLSVEKAINIPDNSYAELYSFDLLGTMAIRFIAGTSGNYYNTGDTIPSSLTPGLSARMDEILDNVDSLLTNLNGVSSSINTIFSENNAKKLDNTIDDLSSAVNGANVLLSPEGSLTNSINSLEVTLSMIEQNNKDIEGIIKNFKSFSDTLQSSELKGLIDSAMMAITEAQELLYDINNGTGTIGKLTQDDSLYINLNKSAESLNKLLIDLKDNPNDYVHFSLFGGKDK